MKLLSAKQFQDWDAHTISHEPISSIELMERAALICTAYFEKNFTADTPIKIFCGKGNNGGDGLAIARLLTGRGYQAAVYILEQGKIGSPDFQTNLHRLQAFSKQIHFVQNQESFPAIEKTDLLIDALYGTGLRAPLNGLAKELVEFLNLSTARIISIDLPSGMWVDQSSKGNTIIKASTTLCFQAVKLCFLAAENAPFFGQLEILPIQLQTDWLNQIETDYALLEKEKLQRLLKKREAFAHKGNFGHALLIAGSIGKIGACILAARAAMRSGLGLLTVSLPASTEMEMNMVLPEAMLMNRELDSIEFSKYTCIGMGPGMGTDPAAEQLLHSVILHFRKPLLLDADAITILAKNPDWLSQVYPDSILTPHPKEFDRLFGASENEFERWEKARRLSEQYQLCILVKGHHTLIAARGKAWLNNTGNVGLAKAGSGDILSGIITALLAQGYASTVAAMLGVYLHGSAADLALSHQSTESLLASDTIERIGDAFKLLAEPD